MPIKSKNILILGGGIGGMVTARDLRKHLGNQHKIILVDKNAFHTFQPSYFWLVIGWRTPADITKPFAPLEKYGIEFHQGEVIDLLPEEQKVITDRENLFYDYLVISLGTENDFNVIPELRNASHTFFTFEGAIELSKIIPRFPGGSINIIVPDLDYKYLPAPYDTAFLLSSFYKKREMFNIEINIITPEKYPLEFAGREISAQIQELLDQNKIKLYSNAGIKSIHPAKKIIQLENSNEIPYDLLISIPKHHPLKFPKKKSLMDEEGWFTVNNQTLQTSYDNIYAIGDATSITLENGKKLPKAGVFANNQAEVVAYNIVQSIYESQQRKNFSGYGFFFIETGTGRAANLHGNFYTDSGPKLTLTEPNVTYHWGKVVLEKYWIWRWF